MSKTGWTILLVDDDEEDYLVTRFALKEIVTAQIEIRWASSYEAGLQMLNSQPPLDAVLVDYRLGSQDGLGFIQEAVQQGAGFPFILLTGEGSYDLDLAAMQAGAADYLPKSEATPRQLERSLRYAIERQRLLAENRDQRMLFQNLIEVNPSGVAILTVDDRVLQLVNPTYRGLTPDPAIDPVGCKLESVWPNYEDFLPAHALHTIIETKQPLRVERFQYTYPDRSRRTLTFQVQPHIWQGRPAVLMSLWETTTLDEARSRAEMAAGAAAVAAAEAAASAQEAAAAAQEAERRANEAEEGRRILQAIMDYLPEGLMIAEGPQARVNWVSKYTQALSGYPREHFAGLTSDQFEASLPMLTPDGRRPMTADELPLTRAALRGEVVENEEAALRTADGRLVQVSCSAAPICDAAGHVTGGVFTMRDITESKRLEGALRLSEARFRGIYEANVIPLCMWHADGRILEANDAYLNLLGYTRQEMEAGKLSWIEITPPEYQARDQEALEEMSIGRAAAPFEKELVRRNGRRVPVLYGGVTLGDYGDRGWFFAVDLTERKHVEQALATINAALMHSNRRLSEVLESITDAYVAFDRDWRFIAINPAAERLVFNDRPAVELIGKVIWDEYPATLEERANQELRYAQAKNESVHFEGFSEIPKRWFEYHAYPREGNLEVYMRDIHDRKRYEEWLVYQSRLLENVHDAIIATDEKFCITLWNRAAADLYGWSEEEVLGHPLGEVIPSEIDPRQVEAALSSLKERTSFRLEATQSTREGRRLVVESSVIDLRDAGGKIIGYINANRDMTARIQAAEERESLLDQLGQQQARLSAIIQNAPVGIIVTDHEARILLVNSAGERLTARPIPYGQAYSSHALLRFASPGGEPFDPRDLPLTRSALDGAHFENEEIQVIWPDGQRRDWLVNSAPIRSAEGQIEGAVAIFQDITERRRTAEILQRNAARMEIQRYLTRARETERLNIAHDLHDGPIQEMVGLTFVLNELLALEPAEEIASQLEDMQAQLQGSIKNLRTFCNELRPPTLAPFGLERAIRSQAAVFHSQHPDLALELDLISDGQALPESVRMTLFQVFRECLNNIHKHARASVVQVRFALEDGQAVLEIRDNGMGFQLPANWVEFARQGHLGLVGMQERAEAVGGRMNVTTAPGEGARLLVTVPYQHLAEEDAHQEDAHQEDAHQEDAHQEDAHQEDAHQEDAHQGDPADHEDADQKDPTDHESLADHENLAAQ